MNHDRPPAPAAIPDPSSQTTPPAADLTLGDTAPGHDMVGVPVTTPDGDTVVVLDHCVNDITRVETWSLFDAHRVLPTSTPVTVTRPDGRALSALRRAFAHLIDRFRMLSVDHAVATGHHQRILGEIRGYAIDRHLEGCFELDDLNCFLPRFHLQPYQPRYTVAFTLTGTYQVESNADNDEESVRQDAEDTLRPNLQFTPWVIDSSEDYDVAVNSITHHDERAGT